jgi:hypothetical protein
MTAERAAQLEALGFPWRVPPGWRGGGVVNEAGCEAQLAKLNDYKAEHGDCRVPQKWAEDPALGSWVANQRTTKKKLDRGEPIEGMSAARASKLDKLGFAWAPGLARSQQ